MNKSLMTDVIDCLIQKDLLTIVLVIQSASSKILLILKCSRLFGNNILA